MKKKSKSGEIKLHSIRTLEFSYSQDAINKKGDFNTDINFKFDFDESKPKILILSLRLVFTSKDKLPLGRLITENTFKLMNINIPIDDNKINIPDQLTNIILSISYSTARGILIEKGSNSIFGNKPLPIMSFLPSRMKQPNTQ